MDLTPFLLVGGLVVAGGLAWFAWKQEQQRRALLMSFARSQGWQYVARDDAWAERFDGDPFGTGDDRRATNVLLGDGTVAFDYQYETHTTDSKGHRRTTTHRYAVCALQLPGWLPALQLTPENVVTRLLPLADVELESEDFNRRYRVQAGDPKFAYDVLHPRTMEALLTRRPLNLRIAGADAVCWDDGRQTPSDVLERLSGLRLLVDGIPSYVWKDASS